MFRDKEKYFEIEEFKKHNIEALYTTKEIGNTDLYSEEGWKNLKSFFEKEKGKEVIIVHSKQTHSDNIIDIKKDTKENFYENVDGFITNRKDVVLVTKYADCLPLYFYDSRLQIIGVSHSGWKGSFKKIGIKTLKTMEENYGSKKDDIIVGIGIGISCEKYEVGDEFYQNFKDNFDKNIVERSFKYIDGKWHFNNSVFNKEIFKSYGIDEKNIFLSDECTFLNNRFNSYRRDKTDKRNIGAIFFK